MTDNPPQADGARVLADLNALRSIGAYKTGVHKPTFSEAAYALAGVAGAEASRGGARGRDRRHRQCARHKRETRTETAGRLASRKPEFRGLARWAAWCRLCARSRPRHQSRSERQRRRRSRGMVRRGRTFRLIPRQQVLCRRRNRRGHRRRARQQRPHHARCPARRRVLPAGRARRPNAGGISDISRRISSKAAHSKAAVSRSASSPPSSVSGNTGSSSAASRITPAPPGWPIAGMPAWRWRGFASPSMIDSRTGAVRARYGPPAASPLIPVRRASSRDVQKCCSRCATMIRL